MLVIAVTLRVVALVNNHLSFRYLRECYYLFLGVMTLGSQRMSLSGYEYQLTQGVVFYGIRSTYYSKPCYAVIITARCDLAQSKVRNVHYLSAVSLNEWIKNDCFVSINDEIEKANKIIVKKWMDEKGLNSSLAENLGPEKIRIILNEYEEKESRRKGIEQAIGNWELCQKLKHNEISEDHIITLLNTKEAFIKKKKEKIKLLVNNQLSGFYFIPGIEIGEGNTGYVINLRDINQMEIYHLKRILAGEIDFISLTEDD